MAHDDTLLVFQDLPIPPYSSRGITQTLQLDTTSSSRRRTVNGTLRSIRPSGFEKYSSSISCNDQAPMNFDGVFEGDTSVVECVCELSGVITAGNTTFTASRDIVSGSIKATDDDGDNVSVVSVVGRVVTIASNAKNVFIRYRPEINFMIEDISQDQDEWGAALGWRLQLREV